MARYARIRDREARKCYKLFYDESLMKRNAACNVCFSLLLLCGIPSSVLYGEMCSRVQEMQQDVAQRISDPPGGVQSRIHANFSPFSRHHARISPLSRNHTNWSHFSTFTQSRTYFFRFHAITQITQMRKGFSRHQAHQKDLSGITHTCQFHTGVKIHIN